MNVSTHLKAGNLLQDASQQAGNYAGQVSNFVGQANQQASSFTTNLVDKTTALWNCLTGSK
jgi:hypothetical protein